MDDDLLKKFQSHFGDGLVTVVGSGLSCAEGLPSMGTLATALEAVQADNLGASDRPLWQSLIEEIRQVGLEAALIKANPADDIRRLVEQTIGDTIQAAETVTISEVFAGKRTLRLTRLIPHLLKPESGLPFVTTNYDRLIEVAVEEAGLGVDTMFVGELAGRLDPEACRMSHLNSVKLQQRSVRYQFNARALISKPHGSMDWYLREGKPVRHAGTLPGLSRLIIPPGATKYRAGYESPFDVHRERANRAINAASRFLIVGYGFQDDHLETHLVPAIKGGVPTLILTKTLSAEAFNLAISLPNVIGVDDAPVGTRMVTKGEQKFHVGEKFWDLGDFIDQVLEP